MNYEWLFKIFSLPRLKHCGYIDRDSSTRPVTAEALQYIRQRGIIGRTFPAPQPLINKYLSPFALNFLYPSNIIASPFSFFHSKPTTSSKWLVRLSLWLGLCIPLPKGMEGSDRLDPRQCVTMLRNALGTWRRRKKVNIKMENWLTSLMIHTDFNAIARTLYPHFLGSSIHIQQCGSPPNDPATLGGNDSPRDGCYIIQK